MCRTLTLALVPVFLMVTWNEARAERYLVLYGTNTTGGALTFYIGAQTLGSQGITTIFGPGTLQNGESVTALRDRLVPEFGIPNVGKRWAGSNVLVFHRDNVQFWVSLDQTNWQLIIPADGTNPNGILFVDTGSNGTTAAAVAGGVPAVGGIGLAVLAAVLLGVGGLIITRRTRASAI